MPASLRGRALLVAAPAPSPTTDSRQASASCTSPAPSVPARITRHDGFLADPPVGLPPGRRARPVRPEVDRYRFSLSDFADVEVLPLASPLLLDVEPWNPWHAPGSLPATLKVGCARPDRTGPRDDVISSPAPG